MHVWHPNCRLRHGRPGREGNCWRASIVNFRPRSDEVPEHHSKIPSQSARDIPGPGEWALSSPLGGIHVSLRRILWATDFSPGSEAALEYAMAIARRYGAYLYLAHVVRPESFDFVMPEAVNAMLDDARRAAEDQMARLLVTGRLRGVSHQVVIGVGMLWPVLSKLAEEHEIDMIVSGTHGRTGFRKLLLGSVAQEIFHNAPCPVLTVGPKVHSELGDTIPARRILYATNFSSAAECSARYAASLAQENQANLTLMHVVEQGDLFSPDRRMEVTASIGQQLRQLVPLESLTQHEPDIAVEFGPPAEMILKVAEEVKADFIVLGIRRPAHQLGHPSSHTAYKVVCEAGCPVLTVPCQQEIHS
jgi:nucleotide-binding universal stress UspA family protein